VGVMLDRSCRPSGSSGVLARIALLFGLRPRGVEVAVFDVPAATTTPAGVTHYEFSDGCGDAEGGTHARTLRTRRDGVSHEGRPKTTTLRTGSTTTFS
jgi:hypothetical protein